MRDIKDVKTAFVGVSHWHVPLYFRAVEQDRLQVVAVSDENQELAELYGRKLGCKVYKDYRQLLDQEKPDFIFAFEKHCNMPELASEIISRGIPFTIEKPLGLCAEDVERVMELAKEQQVFCAIPLTWRYSDIAKKLKAEIRSEDILHISFKFIAGPTSRYLDTSPWMLQKEKTGSGCMTNLGVHFIDLALMLTDSTTAQVLGSMFQYGSEYDVETYAAALLKMPHGSSLEIETGYAYPMDEKSKRDNRWNIVTKKGYYTMGVGCFEFRQHGEPAVTVPMDTDSDSYYRLFAVESIREWLAGKEPSVGLKHLLDVRRILDEIIHNAQANSTASPTAAV